MPENHLAGANTTLKSGHRIILDLCQNKKKTERKNAVVCVLLLLAFWVSCLIFSILFRDAIWFSIDLTWMKMCVVRIPFPFKCPYFRALGSVCNSISVQHSIWNDTSFFFCKRCGCDECVRACLNVNRIQLKKLETTTNQKKIF